MGLGKQGIEALKRARAHDRDPERGLLEPRISHAARSLRLIRPTMTVSVKPIIRKPTCPTTTGQARPICLRTSATTVSLRTGARYSMGIRSSVETLLSSSGLSIPSMCRGIW